MKLGEPVVQFGGSRARLRAKSVAHDRWYAVRGITKTLDSLLCCRRRARSHNMICMDLYAKILRDLNENPTSSLSWVAEHATKLNAPESKAVEFAGALARLLDRGSLNLRSCRRAWDAARMSPSIGNAVDSQCKDVFNGKKKASEVGPVARLVLTQLEALRLIPICAGLKVAGVPTPDSGSGPGSGSGSGSARYTYHNGCANGCRSLPGRSSFYTEVDLLAHDTVKNTVALLELKTRNSDALDDATLWRYNAQLWLTWTMFSLTYPSMAERSRAYLVIIRPGTSTVTVRSCLRPSVTKTLRDRFPWLSSLCPRVLDCLTPTCVNARVRSCSTAPPGDETPVDPRDLCYRNVMFNREKARASEGSCSDEGFAA